MARRSNTQSQNRMMRGGKSPFAEGSAAARIDYAVTRNIRNAYSKLFGAKFDPLYPDRPSSSAPRTGTSGVSREVEAFRQNQTSAHVINTSQQLGEIKGVLTEMSKTLKEIKTAVEGSSSGGILDSLFGGIRSLFTRGRSGGGPSIPGARPASAIAGPGLFGAQNASATGALFGLNEFMNPAVEQLEAIREKLESENTIAVKFSKTSETAKDLSAIAENSEIVAKVYNPEAFTPKSNIPSEWKYDPSTGAAYLEKPTVKPSPPMAATPATPEPNRIDNLMRELNIAPVEPTQTPAPAVQPTNKAERERVGGKRGKDHIGYGHRLTDEELRTGKIKLPDGTELDVNRGITKEEAEKLYEADRAKLDDFTRKTLKKRGVDLDQLPPNVQEVVKDMGFNGPAVFNRNPKIIEGLKKGQATGDYNDLAETVRESMHTADGKVLRGLVKRANERADAILDPNKKLDTKKFEGLETQLYDPLVPKSKRASEPQKSLARSNNDMTESQKTDLTNLNRALQNSIDTYGGSREQTSDLPEPIKPSDRKYTVEEQNESLKKLEDVLKTTPTAQLDPTRRTTGPILGNMETQLANARDQSQTGGAPTIINNTTNNTSSVGGGAGTGPVASVRNEENSLVRMQNMMAAAALS